MTTSLPSFRMPELLAPAGNYEKLQTALFYGADAVYLGGETFNLRASSDGLTLQELAAGVASANARGAKIYYTLNALPLQRDMAALPAAIEAAAAAGVHGFIIADPGVLRLARRYAPEVEVHLSTQVNTTNAEALAFWAEQGVRRVNLARELSCRDIYAIRKAVPEMDLEVFVHGAMCLAVSGQCLLSAWLNKRPANLGRCTHPCRFEYRPLSVHGAPGGCGTCSGPETSLTVAEQTRPDSPLWTVHQGETYSSFWAPLDLCLVRYMPWFIRTGVASLKIEGRMKGAGYVAHVVDAYRTALDRAWQLVNGAGKAVAGGAEGGEGAPVAAQTSFDVAPFMYEVMNTATRPLGSGFFLPEERRVFSEEAAAARPFVPQPLVAKIGEPCGDAAWHVDLRGTWKTDAPVTLMLPGLRRPLLTPDIYTLENHRGERVDALHSGTRGILRTEFPHVASGAFVRGA